MKSGDIKANRVMASKPSESKSFKELAEEFLRNEEVRGGLATLFRREIIVPML